MSCDGHLLKKYFRFAQVSEVSDVVLYFLSDKASMINGVEMPIDGGFLAT